VDSELTSNEGFGLLGRGFPLEVTMSTTLLTWVLSASATLASGRPYEPIAEAIASRVQSEPPLWREDLDRRKTAALLLAVAFRESSLRADAVGDRVRGQPTSYCAFQIHLPFGAKTAEGWTGPELLQDPDSCVVAALGIIRVSMRMCPEHPLAFYAEGPRGCASRRAQAISKDRVSIAQWLVRSVALPEPQAPEPQIPELPPRERQETAAALTPFRG
jgi:hypothetical protein